MALLAGGMIFTSCTNKQYTITTAASPAEGGTVTGGGVYENGAVCQLIAVPNEGWEFVDWQDNSKENPRTVTVTANETWTAHFKKVENPQPQASSVKVTFNGSNWDASYISGRWYTQYEVWDVYSMQTEGSLPIADVATGILSGSQSGTADGDQGEYPGYLDGDFNWVEYYYETYLQDNSGNYYGDYWAKSVTCNVTAFDATALTLTSNVNATMFNAYEAFVDETGVDAASTAPMTVNISNVTLTAAKGSLKAKGAKKMVAVK